MAVQHYAARSRRMSGVPEYTRNEIRAIGPAQPTHRAAARPPQMTAASRSTCNRTARPAAPLATYRSSRWRRAIAARQGGACGAAGPASAPGSALGCPPGARRATPHDCQVNAAHASRRPVRAQQSCLIAHCPARGLARTLKLLPWRRPGNPLVLVKHSQARLKPVRPAKPLKPW